VRAHPKLARDKHQERLDKLHAKKQKLEMLEALIEAYECEPTLDHEHLRDLKKRTNEVRSQLRVLSTTERIDR